jgi:release factor glutamine methyltransferase
MSDPLSTVAQALSWATNQLRTASQTPRLDAELLLAHILEWSRARVLAERQAPLSQPQQAGLRALIARRATFEPIAYLIGHKEFYGLDFIIDHRVLVPRPETELLVEHAIAVVRQMTADDRPPTTEDRGLKIKDSVPPAPTLLSSIFNPLSSKPLSVVGRRSSIVVADIGTGSGCIAVALAVHVPGALIYAADISPEALGIARQNVERHNVAERVRLLEGDLLDALPQPADILVSNPPYTILSEIDEGVRRHEPHLALDGGADGLDAYRRLLNAAPAKLRTGGVILLETGATQGAAVAKLAQSRFPAARIRTYQDLAGLDRVIGVELSSRS